MTKSHLVASIAKLQTRAFNYIRSDKRGRRPTRVEDGEEWLRNIWMGNFKMQSSIFNAITFYTVIKKFAPCASHRSLSLSLVAEFIANFRLADFINIITVIAFS